MKNFQTIWQDIRARRNLDVYFTVILAFFIAILGIFSIVDLATISAAVLATLALVSLSLLQNRRENDSLQNAILQLHRISETTVPFLGHDSPHIQSKIICFHLLAQYTFGECHLVG